MAVSLLQKQHNLRLSPDQLRQRNLKKFRRFVHFLKQRSPYYSDLIRAERIDPGSCFPDQFPELSKSEVMANFDRMVTVRGVTKARVSEFLNSSRSPQDRLLKRFHVVHTSGSSGKTGYFIYSQKEIAHGLAQALRINGLSLRRRRLAFVGATAGHFAGITFATMTQEWPACLFFESRSFDLTKPFRTMAGELEEFQPDILIGYADALRMLASRQCEGKLHIQPGMIQSSGETLLPGTRRLVEKAFGVPLINLYATSEHMFMACGRPEHRGLYLLEDDLIFELHDQRTLVTNLFNRTLPLVRYRMDDILTPAPREESPPFPYTKVRDLIGRNEIAMTFRNEHGQLDGISPIVICGFFVKGLEGFQVQLVNESHFKFRLLLSRALKAGERSEVLLEARARMRGILKTRQMGNVTFDIIPVEELAADRTTGKFRLIVPAPAHPVPECDANET